MTRAIGLVALAFTAGRFDREGAAGGADGLWDGAARSWVTAPHCSGL